LHVVEELAGAVHALGLDAHRTMRGDVRIAIPVVDDRLEDLNLLTGDLRAAKAADQLLALAAEHAAGNDFDPAVRAAATNIVHGWFSGATLVLAGLRVDADQVAVVDERRHRHDEPGLGARRLRLRAGSRALDTRRRLLDSQIDRRRQLDADRR